MKDQGFRGNNAVSESEINFEAETQTERRDILS